MNEQDLWVAITADKAWNRRQARQICDLIATLFNNMPKTRYWISINYFEPKNEYNIFFNLKRKGTFQRSIPLAKYPGLSLQNLIGILKEVRRKYRFTIEYIHFTRDQKRRLYEEIR